MTEAPDRLLRNCASQSENELFIDGAGKEGRWRRAEETDSNSEPRGIVRRVAGGDGRPLSPGVWVPPASGRIDVASTD